MMMMMLCVVFNFYGREIAGRKAKGEERKEGQTISDIIRIPMYRCKIFWRFPAL